MLNLLPDFSVDDSGNCVGFNPESFSKLPLSQSTRKALRQMPYPGVFFSDRFNYFGRQFRSRHSLSPCCSTFGVSIPIVFSYSSKPKMTRIATGWIIAIMKHVLAFWNLSKCQNPGNSICNCAIGSNSESSISVMISVSHPFPAIVKFPLINFFPKPFFHWSAWSWYLIRAFSGTTSTFVDLGWKVLELFSAYGTLVGVHLKSFLLGVQRLVVGAINLIQHNPQAAVF